MVVTITSYRKNLKPYWNTKLSTLKKIKVERFRIWHSAGRPREKDNPITIAHREAKKCFAKELRRVSRSYENEQILNAVSAAELNRNVFWKVIKKSRNSTCGGINAIRISDEVVVHNPADILQAFKGHFARVSTPKIDNSYDAEHFTHVSEQVHNYNMLTDGDEFLNDNFTQVEVQKAIDKLHARKACGYDGVCTEHIKYAGPELTRVLTIIYNKIISTEYIPENFRKGMQVPLYKGKNTCVLDMNNYRGITLLTNFNKIFEILLWHRLEKWWVDSEIISDLQGACRKRPVLLKLSFSSTGDSV